MPQFTTQYITQVDRIADGTNLGGQAPSNPISFFGTTPVVQQASTAAGTDATTVQALVNAIRTALLNYGLIA